MDARFTKHQVIPGNNSGGFLIPALSALRTISVTRGTPTRDITVTDVCANSVTVFKVRW